MDVVDIDLRTRRAEAVGHTWFSLFSPRIQHYTIGVEPRAGLGDEPGEENVPRC